MGMAGLGYGIIFANFNTAMCEICGANNSKLATGIGIGVLGIGTIIGVPLMGTLLAMTTNLCRWVT